MKLAPFALVLLLCGPAACDSPKEPVDAPYGVVVELDALSGLSNPSWSLSSAEARELAGRLRDLPRSDARPPEPSLGYRGFWIRNPGGEGGIAEEVRVAGGLVVLSGAGAAPAARHHDAHGVEGWLRELARSRGYGDLLGTAD